MEKISLSSGGASVALHEVAHLAEDVNKWAATHGVGERTAVWALKGAVGRILHRLGTLLIMISFPAIAVFMWHINESCHGSIERFMTEATSGGLAYVVSAYPPPSPKGLGYILTFGFIQALLQVCVPGRQFRGPPTPKGNVPKYVANGVQCYLLTLTLFFCGWKAGIFDPSTVYDSMGTIVSTSNLFSLALCLVLYLKGRVVPSSTDSGSTGSLMFDYYWGMELFPRIGPFDIKTWTNCRMGMAGWGVITLCYAVKQASLRGTWLPSLAMLVSVGLMHLYVFKFFLWETGYWSSMDIAHDRAGFYLCWGCLVWLPAVYTSPAQWLVRQPCDTLSAPAAVCLFAVGALAVWINFDSDRQRQAFRASGGKRLVWGKPPRKIMAVYTTADGQKKQSLLLASGWWGLARHFHYLPEVIAAFIWSCPGGVTSPIPFVYVVFLTALLADRAYRDDERCKAKYGVYWDQYCTLVPYKIVPKLF